MHPHQTLWLCWQMWELRPETAPVSRRSPGLFPDWAQFLFGQVSVCPSRSRKPPSHSRSALQQQAGAQAPGRSSRSRLQTQTRAQNREQMMSNSGKFLQNQVVPHERMLQGHRSPRASLCMWALPKPSLHPPLAQPVQLDSARFLTRSWRGKPCSGALPGRSPAPHCTPALSHPSVCLSIHPSTHHPHICPSFPSFHQVCFQFQSNLTQTSLGQVSHPAPQGQSQAAAPSCPGDPAPQCRVPWPGVPPCHPSCCKVGLVWGWGGDFMLLTPPVLTAPAPPWSSSTKSWSFLPAGCRSRALPAAPWGN